MVGDADANDTNDGDDDDGDDGEKGDDDSGGDMSVSPTIFDFVVVWKDDCLLEKISLCNPLDVSSYKTTSISDSLSVRRLAAGAMILSSPPAIFAGLL